jgi:hypothetical protein
MIIIVGSATMADLEQYKNVKLVTDKYIEQGAHIGDIGTIIDIYDRECTTVYDIEIHHPLKEKYSTLLVLREDIEPVE